MPALTAASGIRRCPWPETTSSRRPVAGLSEKTLRPRMRVGVAHMSSQISISFASTLRISGSGILLSLRNPLSTVTHTISRNEYTWP